MSFILNDLSDRGVHTVGVKDTCARSNAQPVSQKVPNNTVQATAFDIFSHPVVSPLPKRESLVEVVGFII